MCSLDGLDGAARLLKSRAEDEAKTEEEVTFQPPASPNNPIQTQTMPLPPSLTLTKLSLLCFPEGLPSFLPHPLEVPFRLTSSVTNSGRKLELMVLGWPDPLPANLLREATSGGTVPLYLLKNTLTKGSSAILTRCQKSYSYI